MVRHGRAHALFGESIHQHLLNKTSPGDGLRGMSTPSRLGEDIWIRTPKLGSLAGPDGPTQLYPLVVLPLFPIGEGNRPQLEKREHA